MCTLVCAMCPIGALVSAVCPSRALVCALCHGLPWYVPCALAGPWFVPSALVCLVPCLCPCGVPGVTNLTPDSRGLYLFVQLGQMGLTVSIFVLMKVFH